MYPELFIFFIGAFAVSVLLLWAGNLPKSSRHRQIWSPFLALVLTFGSVVLLYVLPGIVPGQSLLSQFLRWALAPPSLPATALALAFNVAVLLGFGLLKLLARGVYGVVGALRSTVSSGTAYLAYTTQDDEVYLKPSWYFSGLLARHGAIFALLLLVFCTTGQLLVDPLSPLFAVLDLSPPSYPLFPALPLLLLLETGWYLDGPPRPTEEVSDPEVDPVEPETEGTYSDLWEEYQEIWPDHVLAAAKDPVPRVSYPQSVRDTRPAENGLGFVWRNLLRHPSGERLTDDDFEVFEKLWNDQDLLLEDASYERIAPVLFTVLHYDLLGGERTLILVSHQFSTQLQSGESAKQSSLGRWITDWFDNLYGIGDSLQIDHLLSFRQRSADPQADILIASAEEVAGLDALGQKSSRLHQWFESVGAVVVMDGASGIFPHLVSTHSALRTLKDIVSASPNGDTSLQCIVFCENRRQLQPSLRRTLPFNLKEKRLPPSYPRNGYVLCWKTEGSPFQNRFFDLVGYHIGDEPVLSLPAWRDGVGSISLVEQRELPVREFVEEMDAYKTQLRNNPTIPLSSLKGRATSRLSYEPQFSRRSHNNRRSFTLARDRSRNLPRVLRRWYGSGHQSSFVHVVSPPYLLRDYFADNLSFFLHADAPVIIQSPRPVSQSLPLLAHSLLRRLMSSWIEESIISRALQGTSLSNLPTIDALRSLFKSVFGIDIMGASLIEWESRTRYVRNEDSFIEVTAFHLRRDRLLQENHLDWMSTYSVVDTSGSVLEKLSFDLLYQQYLPGQLHTFGGRSYRIVEIDDEEQQIHVSQDEQWDNRVCYRPKLDVKLSLPQSQSPPEKEEIQQSTYSRGDWKVEASLFNAQVRIETDGYYRMSASNGSLSGDFSSCGREVPGRDYQGAHVVSLTFTAKDSEISVDDPESVSTTLAFLLEEILPSVFPNLHRFIHVLPSVEGKSPHPSVLPSAYYETSPPPLSIFFIEDAHAEMGLAQCVLEQWDEILSVLDDYLCWIKDGPVDSSDSNPWEISSEDPKAFLKYDHDQVPDFLALDSTRNLLRDLYGEDRLSVRERRQEYYSSSRTGSVPSRQQACDLCRRPLSQTEFQRLDDGRVRCAVCGETATDTEEELIDAYEEAREFLEQNIGVTLPPDVQAILSDADSVHEATDRDFIPTSSYDSRVRGVAIRRDGNLSILVENGQPYHMAVSAIAHELTHIWQYSHLDYRHMKSEEGLLLVEGHAMWAGLRSIEHLPEANRYIKEQSSRTDIYGEGYRYVRTLLEDNSEHKNPFDLLLEKYPQSDT